MWIGIAYWIIIDSIVIYLAIRDRPGKKNDILTSEVRNVENDAIPPCEIRPYDHLWDMYYDEFEDEEENDERTSEMLDELVQKSDNKVVKE